MCPKCKDSRHDERLSLLDVFIFLLTSDRRVSSLTLLEGRTEYRAPFRQSMQLTITKEIIMFKEERKRVRLAVSGLLSLSVSEAKSSSLTQELDKDLNPVKDILMVYDTQKVDALAKANYNEILGEILDFIEEKQEDLYNRTLASIYANTQTEIDLD
jgi:hypothetical protein